MNNRVYLCPALIKFNIWNHNCTNGLWNSKSCLCSMHLQLLQNFHCIFCLHPEYHLSKFLASSSYFHIKTIFHFAIREIFMFFSSIIQQKNIDDRSKLWVAFISSLLYLHKLELYLDIFREMLYPYCYTEEELVTRSSSILTLSLPLYAIKPVDCPGIYKTCWLPWYL